MKKVFACRGETREAACPDRLARWFAPLAHAWNAVPWGTEKEIAEEKMDIGNERRKREQR